MKFNSIKEALGKAYRKYYFCIIPTLILVILYLSGLIHYSMNDDIGMQNFALSFGTNQHSEQLMFMSIILGYAYKYLYILIPAINWFALSYLVILTASFFVFFKILTNYNDTIKLLLLMIFQIYTLLMLTFTVVAFLSCAAGLLLYLSKVDKLSKKAIPYIFFSFLFLFLGFAFRGGQVFLFITFIFSPISIWSIKNKKNSITSIAVILLLCTVANCANTISNNYYNSKIPEETYYNEFQEYRSAVTDNGTIDYDSNKQYFDNHGISKNDIDLITSFIYCSKKFYNKETLKTLVESQTTKNRYILNPIQIIENFAYYISENDYTMFLLLLLVFTYLMKFSTNHKLIVFMTTFFATGSIGFLFIRQRPVERVISPIIIINILIILFVLKDAKGYNALINQKQTNLTNKRKAKALALALLLFIPSIYTMFKVNTIEHPYMEKDSVIEEYIESRNEIELYVVLPKYTNIRFSYSKLHLLTDNVRISNVVSYPIGGTSAYSYYWYSKLNEHGLNEYKDDCISSLLNQNVYYVCHENNNELSYINQFKTYFKEHYSKNVTYDIVKEFDNDKLKIIKFSEVNQ